MERFIIQIGMSKVLIRTCHPGADGVSSFLTLFSWSNLEHLALDQSRSPHFTLPFFLDHFIFIILIICPILPRTIPLILDCHPGQPLHGWRWGERGEGGLLAEQLV